MSDLPLTIADAARALRARELTSVELTTALLERADKLDPLLGVYITRMDESALRAARRADAQFELGIDRGPLQGIPVGLKDILSTDDAPTTAQSLVMDPTWSEQGDAVVVSRLREAGAVIIGKTTTMEFACGQPDPEKPFPIPKNPWNPEYWTGGSSSGTAGGIAAGLFLGGLGTDTGGSVRGPSAFCGISGIRQTYGRVPKSGCTQNGFSLDTVGPMARTVRDVAILLQVIAGAHHTDITSIRKPVPNYQAALTGDLTGMRIGIVREGFTRNNDKVLPETVKAFDDAGRVLEEAGAVVEEVVIPNADLMITAHAVNNAAEKAGIYLKRMRERWPDWGKYTRVGGPTFGLFFTSADYMQCLRVRRYAQKVIAGLMETYDVLLTPTAPGTAPRLADMGYPEKFGNNGYNTGIWSLVGLPTLAIPMGFANNGLPLSLQITGRPFDEATVLRVGDAYQRLTDWHLRVPPILKEAEVPA